jgi:hypothetical protein
MESRIAASFFFLEIMNNSSLNHRFGNRCVKQTQHPRQNSLSEKYKWNASPRKDFLV